MKNLHRSLHRIRSKLTTAVTTTRSTFKIEDPSLGPGRVDFTGPDEGFGPEGTPKPKIRRDKKPNPAAINKF